VKVHTKIRLAWGSHIVGGGPPLLSPWEGLGTKGVGVANVGQDHMAAPPWSLGLYKICMNPKIIWVQGFGFHL
jgi:hypothetical protein